MSNQFIDIETFARLSGLSVNTVRRKIKTLSEMDKNAYVCYIPVVGRGGQKIMLDKALVTQWTTMSNQEKETIQEQTKEPEYDEIKNGSSQRNDSSIIEILKEQLTVKDNQINELLERLKESQYNLASMQKQLTAPQEQTPGDSPKWWQFWK